MRICIDPGHGGGEPGASANGYVEKNLTLALALELKSELGRCGFGTVMTRSTDICVSLDDRAKIAKDNKCDVIVSCHFNSFNKNAKGFEAIYSLGNKTAQWIGDCVMEEAVKLGITRRKVWTKESGTYPGRNWYSVLRSSEPLAGVILEALFIDNAEDVESLKKSNFLKSLAVAYATGICKAYGVVYTPEPASKELSAPTPNVKQAPQPVAAWKLDGAKYLKD